jgi:radical SAM protein with 4Fe4S-binding SPASM domain
MPQGGTIAMYHLSKECVYITHNNRVIITNRNSGHWLKISKQCFDILNLGITHGFSEEQLISKMEDQDDRIYFLNFFKKLKEINVLVNLDESNDPAENQKKIKQIYFSLTNRCNLSCNHCSYNAQSASLDDTLSTEQVISIVDKIIKCNPDSIIFTGGEPLIRKDFIEILKYTAKKYKGDINILTNGTFIDENNVKVLSLLLSNIDISLDGVDEESCSLVRGKGVFDRVIRSIKLLKKNDFNNTTLSMVLTGQNQFLIDKFIDLNKELGTRPITRAFLPIGRGEQNKEVLMNQYRLRISKNETCSKVNQNALDDVKACTCGAGHRELFIDFNGDVYPCSLLSSQKFRIGNIRDIEDLNKHFERLNNTNCSAYKELNEIQPDVFYKCKDCTVNVFCWSCLEVIERLKNNENAFSNRCFYNKAKLMESIWEA